MSAVLLDNQIGGFSTKQLAYIKGALHCIWKTLCEKPFKTIASLFPFPSVGEWYATYANDIDLIPSSELPDITKRLTLNVSALKWKLQLTRAKQWSTCMEYRPSSTVLRTLEAAFRRWQPLQTLASGLWEQQQQWPIWTGTGTTLPSGLLQSTCCTVLHSFHQVDYKVLNVQSFVVSILSWWRGCCLPIRR